MRTATLLEAPGWVEGAVFVLAAAGTAVYVFAWALVNAPRGLHGVPQKLPRVVRRVDRLPRHSAGVARAVGFLTSSAEP